MRVCNVFASDEVIDQTLMDHAATCDDLESSSWDCPCGACAALACHSCARILVVHSRVPDRVCEHLVNIYESMGGIPIGFSPQGGQS